MTRPRSRFLTVSVFVAGFAVMATEMVAPRLLAPSLGTTQLVWTNVIGTLLAALALGAFLGGRLADRWPDERTYAKALILAGLLLALVPLLSAPMLARAAVGLAERQAGLFLLSLGAICAYFAPPVCVLGMLAPWALRIAAANRDDLGAVAGRFAGWGTLGSILGTFATTLVALPILGTRDTLIAIAAVLVVTGAWRLTPLGRMAALLAAAPIALLAYRVELAPGARSGAILHREESLYQLIEVREDDSGWRRLYLGEGLGVQSVLPAHGLLTHGVWDVLSAMPALTPRAAEPTRVLIVGLAAGTVAWQMEQAYGAARVSIEGVEIDSRIVHAARRFFRLGDLSALAVRSGDGRVFLQATPRRYHVILCDAYRGLYVPPHMATREFYESARRALLPGGLLVLNLATHPKAQSLISAFAATLRSVFPNVARIQIRNPSVPFDNFVFVASARRLAPPSAADLPDALAPVVPVILSGWSEDHDGPGTLLTDDRAPIEWLTDRILLGEIAR